VARSATGQTPESGLATRRADRRSAPDRRSDQRWATILTGAAIVFRRVGYGAATLEDVAEEVGINRASLYYYVGTKAELLVEILHQPIFDMTATVAEIAASSKPPAEKLREAIAAHMHALETSYPELFVFLAEHLHLLTLGDPEGDVALNARRYGNILASIIEEGQSTGTFDPTLHPRIAMMGIVGMCNWTHRWYREDGDLSLSEIGDEFATLAMRGLLVGSKRRTRPAR
jgi:TetR/AcrR family transcriptional regulator, cholesterol catabolism regulator